MSPQYSIDDMSELLAAAEERAERAEADLAAAEEENERLRKAWALDRDDLRNLTAALGSEGDNDEAASPTPAREAAGTDEEEQ